MAIYPIFAGHFKYLLFPCYDRPDTVRKENEWSPPRSADARRNRPGRGPTLPGSAITSGQARRIHVPSFLGDALCRGRALPSGPAGGFRQALKVSLLIAVSKWPIHIDLGLDLFVPSGFPNGYLASRGFAGDFSRRIGGGSAEGGAQPCRLLSLSRRFLQPVAAISPRCRHSGR